MRNWISLAIVVTLVLAVTSPATLGQDGGNAGVGKNNNVGVDEARDSADETEVGSTELGIIALQRIAKADKYAFVFFFRADDERTQAMRAALESGVAEIPGEAEVVVVDVTDSLEAATVRKFGASRAPMPLILALAPSGAITKAFVRNFDEKEFAKAFVSPGEEKCLKALQERKLVLLCVQNGNTAHNTEAMQGAEEFKADQRYARFAEIVTVDPSDETEVEFLKKLKVDPVTEEAITLMLAPPGRLIGTFKGAITKNTLVAAVQKSASGCGPKGCGPKGCGPPKKKP